LRNGDTIEVGKYKIRFHGDEEAGGFEKTMIFKPGMVLPPAMPRPAPAAAPAAAAAPLHAVIKVKEWRGGWPRGGAHQSSDDHRQAWAGGGVHHAQKQRIRAGPRRRPDMPLHNGQRIGGTPVPLHNGDRLELAGTEMQFVQS
jgi:hypothetical protein